MIITHFFKPLGSLTDDELMQRVSCKDDDRAFSELYHRYARRLMGFFFRQLDRDEALASDFTQDAFMRVWTARYKFAGTSFRTWLFTIAFNLLKNHYRHAEHQKQFEQFVDGQQSLRPRFETGIGAHVARQQTALFPSIRRGALCSTNSRSDGDT